MTATRRKFSWAIIARVALRVNTTIAASKTMICWMTALPTVSIDYIQSLKRTRLAMVIMVLMATTMLVIDRIE